MAIYNPTFPMIATFGCRTISKKQRQERQGDWNSFTVHMSLVFSTDWIATVTNVSTNPLLALGEFGIRI